MSLAPCPSCARHVRRTEAVCPFCGASVSLDAPPVAARSPVERLGRAALFTFGAALATTACGGGPSAAYGGPPIDAAVSDSGAADTGVDTGGPGPLYGGPALDAGDDAGAMALYGGPPQDAGDVDMGGSSSDYGAPPPPDSGA